MRKSYIEFIQADQGARRVIGAGIDVEDVFHRADEVRVGLWWNDPLLV